MFKTRRKHILVFNENQWKSKITEDCGFDFYWFSISINWLQLIFIDYYWCYWFLILIEWYRLEKPQWANATAIRVCCKWIHPNVDNHNLRAWKHLRFSELEWKNSATEELKKKKKRPFIHSGWRRNRRMETWITTASFPSNRSRNLSPKKIYCESNLGNAFLSLKMINFVHPDVSALLESSTCLP